MRTRSRIFWILGNPWRAYNRHLELRMLPFWPIQEDFQDLEAVKNRKYRFHYLFPVLVIATVVIDTAINLVNDKGSDEVVLFNQVTMQFLPEFFLRRSNVIFFPAFALMIFSNLALFFDSFPHVDFVYLYSNDHFRLPYRKQAPTEPELAVQLVKFHIRSRKKINQLELMMNFQLYTGLIGMLILTEVYKSFTSGWQYYPSLRIILCIIGSKFVFGAYNLVVISGIHFIQLTRILGIKQRFYLFQLIAQKLVLSRSVKTAVKVNRKCLEIMTNLLHIVQEVEANNRFYSKFITAIIITLGAGACASLNALIEGVDILKASNATGSEYPPLIVWVFYFLFFCFSIFLFNFSSSRTIYFNIRLFLALRQLQFRLLSTQLNRKSLVKLELVNEYKLLLQKSAFRLLNSAPINNRLFVFHILGYVSVFYMKLVTEKYS